MDFRRNQKNQTQEQFLPSSNHQTIIPGITIFSFHCHLASASGAWWQKLRRSFFPQAPKLKLSLITFTGLNLINCKTFIILHHPHCCYVYIPATTCLHIPLAHPCLYYYLLSPQYTVLHILFHYTLHSFFLLIWTYIYIYSCYVSFFCTVHWADLSWFTFHCWLYPV